MQIATLRAYEGRVIAAGLEALIVGPDFDPTDPAEMRRAMHPRKGPEYVLRVMTLGHLRRAFDEAREAVSAVDLIVTHPLALGAQLLARASGRPWASSVLAPISLFSAHDPSLLPASGLERWLVRLGPRGQRLLLRLADLALSRWLAPYREIERELGLPRGPNPILHGQHSPFLVLALFSPLLGPPQPDWPRAAFATGFPFLADPEPLAPEIERFLAAGEPPLVFTLGSAVVGAAGRFYEHSIAATEALGRRALLLVGTDPANRPTRPLSERFLLAGYASHAALFPRAAVVVHQGGIGTSAEALRSGRPMLVVPHSHDQPDNARRLARLGVARVLPAGRYDAKRAARLLAPLLEENETRARARAIGPQIAAERGVANACDAIERLFG